MAFTLRFDNCGDQPIGNVVIVDSLSTRLEYVPDSAECSLDAKFSTQPNEGGSAGGPLRAGQSARALQGRHPPLPLPRAVTYPAHSVCRKCGE